MAKKAFLKRRWVWIVTAATVLVLVVAIFVRGMGISAKRRPTAFEASIAKAAWRFLVPPASRSKTNPVAVTPEVIKSGMAHFADHCAVCHDNDGSGETAIGRGLHPPSPDMREARTQKLTDGELFYAIEQGIPFTGMPSWGTGTAAGEEASWHLVAFIRHLPKITAPELHEMEMLNPKSAGDAMKNMKIDDFLSGKKKIVR